jgi:hypothetical protein
MPGFGRSEARFRSGRRRLGAGPLQGDQTQVEQKRRAVAPARHDTSNRMQAGGAQAHDGPGRDPDRRAQPRARERQVAHLGLEGRRLARDL